MTLVLPLAFCQCGESTTACDNSSIQTYDYLIGFHSCASDCSNPNNHTIYLAGSDDGISWTLISEFEGLAGSVPDLIFHNDFLYIFHTGTNKLAKVNACFDVLEEGDVSLNSDEDSGGFVDPSLIESDGTPVLFYLPGILGQDPAGCSSYPCTKEIHSAVADDDTLESFTQVDGNRAEVTLSSGSFSDPDIVSKSDGTFLLYVSQGQSVSVFTGSSLSQTLTSPDGSSQRLVSNNSGGIPSAIEVGTEMWLYVTSSQSGAEKIRRAVSSDGITTINESGFSTVIDFSISSDFSSETSVSSPSIITWPGDTWSRESS